MQMELELESGHVSGSDDIYFLLIKLTVLLMIHNSCTIFQHQTLHQCVHTQTPLSL